MNAGAAVARGDILLFLHGDTYLPPKFNLLLLQALQDPVTIAGALNCKLMLNCLG
jgi:hypothetical protein